MNPATIRATLARLWNTDASSYDIALAVMNAADIEDGDLEIEVESIISRVLKARDLIDLDKLAAEVAKVLPTLGREPTAVNLNELRAVMPDADSIAKGVIEDFALQHMIPQEQRGHWLKTCITEQIWFGLETAKSFGVQEGYERREAMENGQITNLTDALRNTVACLRYVQAAHPETSGWGVRAEVIGKAEALLAGLELKSGGV